MQPNTLLIIYGLTIRGKVNGCASSLCRYVLAYILSKVPHIPYSIEQGTKLDSNGKEHEEQQQ